MYSLILYGRRLVELQKCCHLRVSVNPLQKASAFFSSFSSADVRPRVVRKGKNFTVAYLVDSLGLATKLAESISRKVTFQEKANPVSILNLLRSHGFTDFQISSIIKDYPQVLMADAEKSLGPKLQFLQSRGASSSELTEVLSKVPKILGMKEDKTMHLYYEFVKEMIESDKSSKYEKLCHSLPEGSRQGNIFRNISVLRELGIPQKLLFSLLTPVAQPVCGKERFEESLKKVLEMGFDPNTSKFVCALKVVYRLSTKTIEEKVIVYKRLGFDVDDVWDTFKKCPSFLNISEKNLLNSTETFIGLGFSRDEFVMMVKCFPPSTGLSVESVKKKTEFLVKKMNWPLKAIVSCPQVLGYSMDRRIVPRCNVIEALMSKGFPGSELPPMSSVLVCPDQKFLKRISRKAAYTYSEILEISGYRGKQHMECDISLGVLNNDLNLML